MNSKHPDKDIDSIFKEAIDGSETEPSDKFWNRAFEDIIKRENRMYGKQVRNWKTISYMLGAAIVLLAFYTFYLHNKIIGVEKQVTQFEKWKATPVAINNKTATATIASTTPVGTTNVPYSTSLNSQSSKSQSPSTSILNGQNNRVIAANNNNETTSANNETLIAGLHKNYSNPGSNNTGTGKNSLNGSYGFGNETPAGNYYSDTGTNSTESKNSSLTSASSHTDSSVAAKDDTLRTIQPNENTQLADNKTCDTIKALTGTKKAISSKTFLSHIYASAYFSPELSKNIIDVNNAPDNETVNTIKSGQTQNATYSTGIKIGYDLSKHWSILTGAYYHAASFSLLSRVFYAQSNYSTVTSNGTLKMPADATQYADDSLKASGTSSWAYVGIPLQARYDFLPGNNLDFYAEGGFAANFLTNTNTTLNWEGAWGSGHCTINSYNGLQNFFVYNIGVGAMYKITKGLLIFAEPGMQGPLTPISKNSTVVTYPYIMDLTFGLTYHF